MMGVGVVQTLRSKKVEFNVTYVNGKNLRKIPVDSLKKCVQLIEAQSTGGG